MKGISFLGLLALLLIGLKLGQVGVVATWSWWLVLLPLYIFPAIALALLTLCGVGMVVAWFILYLLQRSQRLRGLAKRNPVVVKVKAYLSKFKQKKEK